VKEQFGDDDKIVVTDLKQHIEISEKEFSEKTVKTIEYGNYKAQFEKEISDFKLVARIGGGAFGTVYLG
jgi:hypothetical protein